MSDLYKHPYQDERGKRFDKPHTGRRWVGPRVDVGKGPVKVDRQRVEYCFEQATMAGRFSQEYCVDRLVELLNATRLEEAKWWGGSHHGAKWANGSCPQCDRMAELEGAAAGTTRIGT